MYLPMDGYVAPEPASNIVHVTAAEYVRTWAYVPGWETVEIKIKANVNSHPAEVFQ